MYPRTYYETFMRYEASDEVFVAMPFSKVFENAYLNIIEPAIKNVTVHGKPLKPRIVNRGTAGSPDIHELIFDAIIHSRLVIADVTVQASCMGDDRKRRWQPNANVLYEVGLASAWRNPEDIILIHQKQKNHAYSFDLQNLRHFQYDLSTDSMVRLSNEIVAAIKASSFLANQTYLQIVTSLSPTAMQFMHTEKTRYFPVITFPSNKGMPIFDSRTHAIGELLGCGALKARNVPPQGDGKGIAVIYEWTILGLRLMHSIHVVDQDRLADMMKKIASVPKDQMPMNEYLTKEEDKQGSLELGQTPTDSPDQQ